MILTKWINGSLPVFGYFHAHYLFSLALVLAMASFLSIGSPSDLGAFETSLEMLRSMSENGNLAASEFHMNLVQVKECLDRYREANPSSPNPISNNDSTTTIPVESTPIPLVPTPSTTAPATSAAPNAPNSILTPEDEPLNLSGYALPSGTMAAETTAVPGFTTAMAFLEPTMQDFLAQSDFDLGLLHPVDTFMSEESFYTSQGI